MAQTGYGNMDSPAVASKKKGSRKKGRARKAAQKAQQNQEQLDPNGVDAAPTIGGAAVPTSDDDKAAMHEEKMYAVSWPSTRPVALCTQDG